jgi:hypothetical protein
MSDLDKSKTTTTQNVMPKAGSESADAVEPHRFGEQANSKDSNDDPSSQASGGHSETKPEGADPKHPAQPVPSKPQTQPGAHPETEAPKRAAPPPPPPHGEPKR